MKAGGDFLKKQMYITIILCFLVILLTACNQAYKEAMENGKEALSTLDYETAHTYFEEALLEKNADEEAEMYMNQIEEMLDGIAAMDEGEMIKAEEAFDEVIATSHASDELIKEAEAKLEEIENITSTYEEVTEKIEEVETLHNDGMYNESLDTIEKMLEKDLTHPYVKELHTTLTTLEKQIKKNEKKRKEIDKIIDEVAAHEQDKAYDAGLKAAEEGLEEDLTHDSLKEREAILKELQTKLKNLQKEERIKQKQETYMKNVEGIWVDETVKEDYLAGVDICKINAEAVSCVTMESDNIFHLEIYERKANMEQHQVLMNDGEFVMTVTDENNIRMFDHHYTRVTNEIEQRFLDDFGYDSVDEFYTFIFNPEFFEAVGMMGDK